MPILPIDSGRYGSNEIRRIFEEENRLRYQLDFEAEVALSQGKLNLIPLNASKEISKIARSNKITLSMIQLRLCKLLVNIAHPQQNLGYIMD